jgi:hypothetical protein
LQAFRRTAFAGGGEVVGCWDNILEYATELLGKKQLVLSAARMAWNGESSERISKRLWGDAGLEGGRDIFIRSISDFLEKAS